VIWSDRERRAFQQLVASYGHPVSVYSAGDNIAALLRNPVAAAAVPDVAIVSRPGLIQEPDICQRIQEFPRTGDADSDLWGRLSSCAQVGVPTRRGVWIKTAHKSLVWHRPDTMPNKPNDWDKWHGELEEAAKLARTSSRPVAPLSIGAADGWVLTDWFENVLLGTVEGRNVYRQLAAGSDPALWKDEAVKEALTRLGCLWDIPGLLPGGGRRALTIQFEDSVLDVFRYRHAQAVAAPDFAWQVVERFAQETADSYRNELDQLRFQFPGLAPEQPIVVGGDAAVALTSGGEAALDFLKWLDELPKKSSAWSEWMQETGSTRLFGAAATHSPPIGQAQGVQDRRPMEFDLSDQLTGRLAGGDGQGLWRILTRFFEAVTVDGESVKEAVEKAVALMAATAGDRS